jgi:hypothetical protein
VRGFIEHRVNLPSPRREPTEPRSERDQPLL